MTATTQYPYKRIIQLDEARKAAIRAYRFEHKMLSDAEAIRALLDAGLAANGERSEAGKRGVRR